MNDMNLPALRKHVLVMSEDMFRLRKRILVLVDKLADYDSKIELLEKENTQLKIRLDEYRQKAWKHDSS